MSLHKAFLYLLLPIQALILDAQVVNPPVGDGVILTPTRLVLEGRERASEVLVRNGGGRKTTFRISLVEKAMNQDGKLEDYVKKPGELTAADLVRFTPRQVDLEPGESQIIRVQVRKPENLPDGEYRSHLLVQAVPEAKQATPVTGEGAEKSLSFAITQVMGISIPVIVRQGNTTAKASLVHGSPVFYQPSYPNSLPVISLLLKREGNRSFMGSMEATLAEPFEGLAKGTKIFTIPSVGIYTNIEQRRVFLGVPQAKDGKFNGAKVKVTFTPSDIKLAPVSTEVTLNR